MCHSSNDSRSSNLNFKKSAEILDQRIITKFSFQLSELKKVDLIPIRTVIRVLLGQVKK